MTLRLTVNVNEECAASIQAYARAHDVPVTEAVRHAISLLNHYDVQRALGYRFAVVDRTDKVIMILGDFQ